MKTDKISLQKAVIIVSILNFIYFFIEAGIAFFIQSVSLFADSIDFLEDAFVNYLIFVALGWNLRHRALVGMLLSGIILFPAIATLWTIWQKISLPIPPNPNLLSITGLGALVINLFCAFLLARFKSNSGSLAKAAFLSARNDALANIAIIFAAVITLFTHSHLPDLIVGIGIFFMNLDAAREVYSTAREEHKSSSKA